MQSDFYTPLLVLQRTPVSPRRWIFFGLLLAMGATAVSWFIYGNFDIVVVGRGRIIPSGSSLVVQAVEPGRIRSIHVRDGDLVRKGDTIFTFEQSELEAEEQRFLKLQTSLGNDLQRINRLLGMVSEASVGRSQTPKFQDDETESRFGNRRDMFSSKLGALRAQATQQISVRESAEARLDLATKVIPLLTDRVGRLRTLMAGGNAPHQQLIDAEVRLFEAENAMATARTQIAQSIATTLELQQKMQELQSEFQTQLYDERSGTQIKLDETRQQLARAIQRKATAILTAPSLGRINRLSVNTLGGFVNAGQILTTIIPESEDLEIIASISSSEIGFVQKNQTANVKIDAYPYNRHGVVRSVVKHVSPEAILGGELTPAEMLESPARQAEQSDPFKRAFVIRMNVATEAQTSSGEKLRLSPGMTVTADIVTGQRPVYEYFFTSLLERSREFGRER